MMMVILKTTMKERIIFMPVKGGFFSGILIDISFSNILSSGLKKIFSTWPSGVQVQLHKYRACKK